MQHLPQKSTSGTHGKVHPQSQPRAQFLTAAPLLVFSLILIALMATTPANATKKSKNSANEITVRGDYNTHITIKAPIRQTNLGKQARLPNGTWIWCEGDCAEAIKHQYIDFWERQRELTSHIHP